MRWKKEYETGQTSIDDQHKDIIALINKFRKGLSDKGNNSFLDIGQNLTYLIKYTSFHFSEEEQFMQKISYPDYIEHKQKHVELIGKLRDILIRVKNKQNYTPIEFYYFLSHWLNDHILIEDIKIKNYCDNNRVRTRVQKIPLTSPYNVIEVIEKNLEKINSLYSNKVISKDEFASRRRNFFERLKETFDFESNESKVHLKAIIDNLSKNNRINDEEKKYFI